MTEAKTLNGNIDDSYKFKKGEENHYHVQVNERVHLTDKQEYDNNYRVIKYTPHNFLIAEKNGGFSRFVNVKILHNPNLSGDIKGTGSLSLDTNIHDDYLLVFKEKVPEGMEEVDIEKELKSKISEIKEEVREIYILKFKAKPGNKGVITMLRELNAEQ